MVDGLRHGIQDPATAISQRQRDDTDQEYWLGAILRPFRRGNPNTVSLSSVAIVVQRFGSLILVLSGTLPFGTSSLSGLNSSSSSDSHRSYQLCYAQRVPDNQAAVQGLSKQPANTNKQKNN